MKQVVPFLPSIACIGSVYVLPRQLFQQGTELLRCHPESGPASRSNMSVLRPSGRAPVQLTWYQNPSRNQWLRVLLIALGSRQERDVGDNGN